MLLSGDLINSCDNCEHDVVRNEDGEKTCYEFKTCSVIRKDKDHFVTWPIPWQELFHYEDI